jgi:hypothetical protein
MDDILEAVFGDGDATALLSDSSYVTKDVMHILSRPLLCLLSTEMQATVMTFLLEQARFLTAGRSNFRASLDGRHRFEQFVHFTCWSSLAGLSLQTLLTGCS